MAFVFKARSQPQFATFKKATGTNATVLNRLRAVLDRAEPQAMKWLVRTWGRQRDSISYAELREAVLSGQLSAERLREWQREYGELVNNKLAPQWKAVMALAAAEQAKKFPHLLYDPAVGSAQAFIDLHGAELVTRLVDSQKDALRAMIAQATHYNAMTADDLAYIMRPLIGLTAPQSVSNMNYYNAVKSGLLEVNPNMRTETAEKRARDAAAKQAGRQHRYRDRKSVV